MKIKLKSPMREMLKLSFGEEVGNAVSHGVMAIICLFMIPFTAVYSYITGGMIKVIGESVYIICIFLMFLGSCIYHSMEFGSNQKYVFRKLDHCFIYPAIAGTYTPFLLIVVGGKLGFGLLAAEWIAALAGILMTAISKYHHRILSMVIYLTMGWIAIFVAPIMFNYNHLFFALVLLGGLFYTVGVYFYSRKYDYAHFIWHIFIVLASVAHYTAVVFLI